MMPNMNYLTGIVMLETMWSSRQSDLLDLPLVLYIFLALLFLCLCTRGREQEQSCSKCHRQYSFHIRLFFLSFKFNLFR